MTIDERIKYAEQKRDEAFSNDSVQNLCYWDGYIAALKAVSDESGYRKASEVAEDIIRILRAAGINEHRYPVIAKLKKNYTEGEG